MKLSQGTAQQNENLSSAVKRESRAATAAADKLKASNFPASLLRIGSWEVYFEIRCGCYVLELYFCCSTLTG